MVLTFTFTVTAKVESQTMDGAPKLTLQGQFAATFGDSEPTDIGALAIPASEALFDEVECGDVLTFPLGTIDKSARQA